MKPPEHFDLAEVALKETQEFNRGVPIEYRTDTAPYRDRVRDARRACSEASKADDEAEAEYRRAVRSMDTATFGMKPVRLGKGADIDPGKTDDDHDTQRKPHTRRVRRHNDRLDLKECAGELAQLVRRAAWFRRNADRYEQQRTTALESLGTE